MKNRILVVTAMLMLAAAFTARVSFAADPIEVGNGMYKLVSENDRVRVMEVTFKPGDKIAEHSHPDHFVYVLEAGTLQITNAAGSTDAVLKVGDVIFINAESHSAVNTGTTQVRLLVTELKEAVAVAAPAKTAEDPAAGSEHPAAGSEHPASDSEHPAAGSEHPGR